MTSVAAMHWPFDWKSARGFTRKSRSKVRAQEKWGVVNDTPDFRIRTRLCQIFSTEIISYLRFYLGQRRHFDTDDWAQRAKAREDAARSHSDRRSIIYDGAAACWPRGGLDYHWRRRRHTTHEGWSSCAKASWQA
jgi:hypothetical protein